MIDIWFNNDLDKIFKNHKVAVFIDELGDTEFLLKTVSDNYKIHKVDSDLDELHEKYLIEKDESREVKHIIYTRKKKDSLTFVREYCETNGCLEIRYLQNYIKEKLHQTLNLNINFSEEDLIAAAKISVGKDSNYWLKLSHNGATEIFDLNKELLPFLYDPETYLIEKYDQKLIDIFYRKVNNLLGQEYINKPASTLAKEVANSILDGLVKGKSKQTLESVYIDWLDSITYRDSFQRYLKDYTLPAELDVWKVNINHPFRSIDEKWLYDIGKKIHDKMYIKSILPKLQQRRNNKQAKSLNINFWDDIITLLQYDTNDISYLNSINECIEYYSKKAYKLDSAIRNLYSEFLNNRVILEPFQELYKEQISVFLDKWFEYWGDYSENQTGTLQRIIDENKDVKIAVIVGDGVAYEIAELISNKTEGHLNLKKDIILSDLPSETENGMSRIYINNGGIEAIQNKREKYLESQNSNLTIDFQRLDEINNEARSGDFLICTYKDIDEMGEKLQLKSLKYFPETIDFFANKITNLLDSGYSKVYLISDHGFVLTGLLSESDKISVSPNGDYSIAERYIRTENRQNNLTSDLIEVEKHYKHYKYLYFAKNINPFKSPGLYGFSHGGITPQELITPYFCWSHIDNNIKLLSVAINNKSELQNVTGDIFTINLKADKSFDELFSKERKIYLVFFANEKQINKSEIFVIKESEEIIKEYTFDGNTEIKIQLLDASSKQLLDKTIIRQNNDRDLGGLL